MPPTVSPNRNHDCPTMEAPSPYDVALVVLICLHCESPLETSALYQGLDDPASVQASVERWLPQVIVLYREPTLTTSGTVATFLSPTIAMLRQQLQTAAGNPIVADRWHTWLATTAASSVDGLFDVAALARHAIKATRTSHWGAGSVIRRLALGLEQLDFSGMARLWQALREQVEVVGSSTSGTLDKDGGTSPAVDATAATKTSSTRNTSVWTPPATQLEQRLRHWLHHPSGGFTTATDGLLDSLLQDLPLQTATGYPSLTTTIARSGTEDSAVADLPSLHLLRFLHSVRQGERVQAIEELHSYFDRALGRAGGGGQNTDTNVQNTQATHNRLLPFAPVLLSALHCQTGHVELSKLATQEAAQVAQNSRGGDDDMNNPTTASAVAFALGWLYENNLAVQRGSRASGGDERLLQRCARRAGSSSTLATGAHLRLVQHVLAHPPPSSAYQIAWKHWTAAWSEPPSAEAAHPQDRPTRLTATTAMSVAAKVRLAESTLWARAGQASLAALTSLGLLWAAQENKIVAVSPDDALAALANVARHSLVSTYPLLGLSKENRDKVPEEKKGPFLSHRPLTPIKLENVSRASETSNHSSLYGDFVGQLLDWGPAVDVPSGAADREIQYLLHEWALRRGDYTDAHGLFRLLKANVRPMESVGKSDRRMIAHEAVMMAETGQLDTARALLRSHGRHADSQASPDATEQVYITLQQALLNLQVSNEYVASGLAPLLTCLAWGDDLQLMEIQGPTLAILGRYFLALGEPELALSTLRVALPRLLQANHLWFQGQAFVTVAKCHLALLRQEESSPMRKKKLRVALQYLKRAVGLLRSCQDAKGLQEIYYLQARLYASPLVADKDAQRTAADKFVDVARHLSSSTHKVDVMRRSCGAKEHLVNLSQRSFPQTA